MFQMSRCSRHVPSSPRFQTTMNLPATAAVPPPSAGTVPDKRPTSIALSPENSSSSVSRSTSVKPEAMAPFQKSVIA